MPYPHDMGHAEQIWLHEITINTVGKIKIMGAVEVAYLGMRVKSKPQWIAFVTYSVYLCEDGMINMGGSSGYLFSRWCKTKEEATKLVIGYKDIELRKSY